MVPTESSSSATACLESLIDRLHRRERLRVWSIVITVYGDAIVPRGGVLWLGALQALLERLRIEPGALRAAMSRLASDHWLSREKRGRRSYYALSETGERSFALATQRIYAAGPVAWDGGWTICVAPEEAGEARDARRKALRELGFGTLGPTVFCRPDTEDAPDAGEFLAGAVVFSAKAPVNAHLPPLTSAAWLLEDTGAAYNEILRVFSPLLASLRDGAQLAPLDAMAARTLLIHDFRRIALKDPLLPPELLPEDWAGREARETVAELYRLLLPQSDRWLDGCDGAPDGGLPPNSGAFSARFGGLPS
ncbi:PaaX family transcriptional regulator [Denitrobaculum tricleocarpae]|uniref:Phenylacetic acid degradation protein n=1 Tax=Denitrobaculum tricleocarpae TaxID=2591009 RepID=A0A545TET7_9PROT|nr:PaaX family transcriptional regulator C-terminal domain-containing protein [Denitrobaculum tricleocarpae]TQV75722.1 phenylacetic acid degradation protein [Denitrobaculum tricleocarpae]